MIPRDYPKFWNKKGFLAHLLLPFSLLYYFATWVRRLTARPIRFSAKVICVGNATIGGTGKTQVIITLAKFLRSKGVKFIIVTKGYGSGLKGASVVTAQHSAGQVGDEAMILQKYGTVIASPKPTGILPLIKRLKPEVILFDDGLQNPTFYKDFSILAIDGSRGFGNEFLIPAGPLRQNPAEAIEQSDALVIVGKGSIDTKTRVPAFQAEIRATSSIGKDKPYLAFSGLGNNERFWGSLRDNGINVWETVSFQDHYNYRTEDIVNLRKKAAERSLSLITTEKDYVKIEDKSGIECFEVELFIENMQTLERLIDEKIIQKI